MQKKVLITRTRGTEAAQKLLIENGCTLILRQSSSRETYLSDVQSCDAVLVCGVSTTKEILDAATHVRIISSFSAGVDRIDIPYATKKGIWVANSGDANSNAVAEHTMFLLLSLAKRANEMRRITCAADFSQREQCAGCEIAGSTIGLIGCGNIGRRVAHMARAGFNMQVVVFDPYLEDSRFPEGADRASSLHELLSVSDFVSVHMPLTEETTGFIAKETFESMKPGAYFINASRGALAKEADLIQALQHGTIAGAGLDVFECEPPDSTNPLLQMENVVVTPHSAANISAVWQQMGINAARNILAVFRGETPPYALNKLPCGKQAI